jgi:U3 small nucleolar ribonucleoprotein protein IMP3
MRKLKFHEKKLLKKVDFLQWKREHGHRELQVRARPGQEGPSYVVHHVYAESKRHGRRSLAVQVIRRYHVQDREEYKKYNRLCGMITKLTSLLYRLDPTDDDRIKVTNDLLDKYVELSPLGCTQQQP